MTKGAASTTPDQVLEQVKAANEAVLNDWIGKFSASSAADYTAAYQKFIGSLAKNSERWTSLQQQYYQKQFELWFSFLGKQSSAAQSDKDKAQKGDRRFSAPEWAEFPLFDYVRQSYQLASDWLTQAVNAVELDQETKRKLIFATRQYVDAMAPSNFLSTNPEALKLALETKGESLAQGFKNLLSDVGKGRISMTDETAFAVGKNIAVSPGAVVFENELIQLIQYSPLTAQVYERPLLMVPPCINKFYIMDLEPDNSFVRFAVEQGHTVFLVSWRNVKEDQQQLTWDDYLNLGLLKAIEVTRAIGKLDKINVLGFCVGGTLLASALAVAAARKQNQVESMTLMTTLLEFSDVGDIGVYVDDRVVQQREREFKGGGLVAGKELAMAFSSLRANDLIWSYVVSNYLKGKQPPAFNLLYWNSDATNLPGPMYAYYLRNFYHENHLIKPGKLKMCGEAVDIGKIKAPTYVFAAIEDHIVPWKSAFASTEYLGGKAEFALGASGHIAGSMNPASKNKRNFWVDGELGKDPDQWLESAKSVDGSWWKHWGQWLRKFGGKKIAARKKLGDSNYKPIEQAPGSYVMIRCDDHQT